MNDLTQAAKSFFTLAEISRLMLLAHRSGRKWECSMEQTSLDEATTGYSIRIDISEPTAMPPEMKGAGHS